MFPTLSPVFQSPELNEQIAQIAVQIGACLSIMTGLGALLLMWVERRLKHKTDEHPKAEAAGDAVLGDLVDTVSTLSDTVQVLIRKIDRVEDQLADCLKERKP